MTYDVLIIGGGPGGIYTAWELLNKRPDLKLALFESGHTLERRRCPIDGVKVKSCVHCPTCAIMNGFGGAGAFSDGKYNITNQFGGTLHEHIGKKKALELMEHVGLAGQMKKKTGKYSRGMRQRLGLADVLIKNPEIIILDEPTSGIDPAGVQEFIELIRQLSRKEGLTVLFSSHHLDQVQKVCDRVGLFNSGKLVTLIDMSDLKDKHQELSDIYSHYMEEGGERHE